MDKRIIEGIEACRPGSDDMLSTDLRDVAQSLEHDPEAQNAYRRVQKWDAAVVAAMEKVPVPAGLAERILDRLNAESSKAIRPAPCSPLENAIASSLQAADAEAIAGDGDKDKAVQTAPPRWSRRQLLAVASSLAAALAVAAYVGIFWQPRSTGPVEARTEEWIQQLGKNWQSILRAPREFPVSSAVVASPTAWQRIGNVASGRGVAYKLKHAQAGAAMLFVVKLSTAGLPTAPPVSPQSTTGGKAIGYWQSGGLLYVLVVEGDERSYRAFVNSVQVPLA
ncbi:MAG: hypothetical protein HY288_16225 [Planctomycetia bacterium]|nr:hypothetical protein [Planctomycetia bacterium]